MGKIFWELVCNGVDVSFENTVWLSQFFPLGLVEIIKTACAPAWKERSNALMVMDSLILFSMDSFKYDGHPLFRNDLEKLTSNLKISSLEEIDQVYDHYSTIPTAEEEASDYMESSSMLSDSILSPAFMSNPRLGQHAQPRKNSSTYEESLAGSPGTRNDGSVSGSPTLREGASQFPFPTNVFSRSTVSRGSGSNNSGSAGRNTTNSAGTRYSGNANKPPRSYDSGNNSSSGTYNASQFCLFVYSKQSSCLEQSRSKNDRYILQKSRTRRVYNPLLEFIYL
jgi:hypothetical protein